MKKLKASLKTLNDWRYQLYLIIEGDIKKISQKYKIEEKELETYQKRFYIEAQEIISGNRKKFLIIRKNKSQTPESIIRELVIVDESLFELNKKEIIELLRVNFIYPLVQILESKNENKRLKLEKDLIHRELEKEYSDDKRKPKLKVDDIIKEFLTKTDYNKNLLYNKTKLGMEIYKWSNLNYPEIRPSLKTIIPKLSNSELEFVELINELKANS